MGLAPVVVDKIFEFLGQIAASGTALLIVEQYVNRALALADRVYLSEQGQRGVHRPAWPWATISFAHYLGTAAGAHRTPAASPLSAPLRRLFKLEPECTGGDTNLAWCLPSPPGARRAESVLTACEVTRTGCEAEGRTQVAAEAAVTSVRTWTVHARTGHHGRSWVTGKQPGVASRPGCARGRSEVVGDAALLPQV